MLLCCFDDVSASIPSFEMEAQANMDKSCESIVSNLPSFKQSLWNEMKFLETVIHIGYDSL